MTALAHVPTVAECDRSVQLQAIAESGACEAGRVVMLDFSLVREKVGARWDARCHAIWDHTERTIRRHVQSTAIFCRADQTSYVVSFNNTDSLGAQAFGFRIMEDVITHFLGSCSSRDLLVKTVSSILDNEIVASPSVFRAEYLTSTPALSSDAPPERPNLVLPSLTRLIDSKVQQAFSFDHVFNVKVEKPVALRVASIFTDPITQRSISSVEQASLPTRIQLEADMNTFEMLGYIFQSMPPKIVIAPISLQTTTNSRSRSALMDFLYRLDSQMKGRFVVELYGLEDGTPASRLSEAMTVLRPFCRSVMARINSSRAAISNARTARLSAVNMCAPDGGGNQAKLAANLLTFGEATRGLAPLVMVTDLPNAGFLSICEVAGITHASVKGLTSALDG